MACLDRLTDHEWERVVVIVNRLSDVGHQARITYRFTKDSRIILLRPRTLAAQAIEQDLALGQLIYDLRTEAGLRQRELAERMGTTQSVISRLEEGGGARNRIDTLARVATALNRHLILSFPEKLPDKLKDAVQVA